MPYAYTYHMHMHIHMHIHMHMHMHMHIHMQRHTSVRGCVPRRAAKVAGCLRLVHDEDGPCMYACMHACILTSLRLVHSENGPCQTGTMHLHVCMYIIGCEYAHTWGHMCTACTRLRFRWSPGGQLAAVGSSTSAATNACCGPALTAATLCPAVLRLVGAAAAGRRASHRGISRAAAS